MALASLASIGQQTWVSFLGFVPNLIVAIILLIVGFIVGKVMGLVVREILIRTGVDRYLKKEEHLKFKASSVFDVIVRWAIYAVFISSAVQVLGIPILSSVMLNIAYYIPRIVGSIIVILSTYAIAIYIKDEILAAKTVYSDILGKVVFFLILFIGIAIGIPIIGIDTSLIDNLLLIIAGSFGIGIALAMGFGLKDVISEISKDYAKDFNKKRTRKTTKRRRK